VLTAVHRTVDDFTPAQLQDCEFLREFVVDCLAPPEVRSAHPLADRQVRTQRRPIAKDNPSRRYEVDGESFTRPRFGSWATTVHATATRPASYSRELHQGSIRHVQAIWRLKSGQIQSILARYSHNPSQRAASRQRLIARAARQFSTAATQHRARVAAGSLLCGGSPDTVRVLLGIERSDWRACHARKTVYQVGAYLEWMDVDSLLAWRREFSRKG
jgi:hypothetical protein